MTDEPDIGSGSPDPIVLVPQRHDLRLAEGAPEIPKEHHDGGALLPKS